MSIDNIVIQVIYCSKSRMRKKFIIMNIKNKKDETIDFVMYTSEDVAHFIIATFIAEM